MKKTFITILVAVIATFQIAAQNGVAINTTGAAADQSAMLDVSSSTQGLLIPRLTEYERDNIQNPSIGLLIFNITSYCLDAWTGTNWKQACFDCTFALPTVSNNSPLCEGESLFLNATNLPGATYSWSGPNNFSSNIQNPIINNVTSIDAGTYSLIVTYNGCTAKAITSVVNINQSPPSPIASSNSPICEGDQINLFASTIPNAFYSWSGPNGSFTSTLQNPDINNANIMQSGTYSVSVTVNGCSGPPSTTDIIVNPLPPIADAGTDQLNLIATSTTLSANTPANGTGQWSIISGVGGSINNPSSPTSSFSGVSGNSYVLQWTISNSLCTDSYDQVNISFANIKRVFITSTGYNGNLGGISGANAKCQSSAIAAGLTGTYKAWISISGGSSPSNSFTQSNSPYVLMDNTIVANDWNDLIDGTLQSPINISEYGSVINSRVWSQTSVNGSFNSSNCTNACSNWTTSDANTQSMWGLSTATNFEWSYSSSGSGSYTSCGGTHQCNPCSCSYSLYCFEQ